MMEGTLPDETIDEMSDEDEVKELKLDMFESEEEDEVFEMDLLIVVDEENEVDDVVDVEVNEETEILNTGTIDVDVADVDDVECSDMVDNETCFTEKHVHFESDLAEAVSQQQQNSVKGLAAEKEDGRTRPKLGTTLGRGSREDNSDRTMNLFCAQLGNAWMKSLVTSTVGVC